jgi:hypothetical protein
MNTNKKTAIVAGALYIIATAAGVLSVIFTKSIRPLPILPWSSPGFSC